MMEPDQIDMIDEHELRNELREVVKELVSVRAKAKAYDEGLVTWAVVTQDGLAVNIGVQRQCIKLAKEYNESPAFQNGYTCRKVRVCKEVAS